MISESKLEQIRGMNKEELETRRDGVDRQIAELRLESKAITKELRARRGIG